MKKIFYSLLISVIALVILSSCYAMSDDGVMSSIDYNVIVSNGYPHYRDVRVIYYYYSNDYYYPHYYNGHRYFRRYYRPLPPPRRHRPPQPRFDRIPPKAPNHGSFGNMHRRPQMNNNVGKFGHRR